MTDVGDAGDAPPKQVALAMDRMAQAARLIADIRLGADNLIEVLFDAGGALHHSKETVQLITKEEAIMRKHFNQLRELGRKLEQSGVLNGSIRSRGNSWGLSMPLVCSDGAIVAYAWKRQLAGQAGASAVDRTRLALKAFTDQKRRFFPHLEDEPFGQHGDADYRVTKKHYSCRILDQDEEAGKERTLSDILMELEREAPNMRVFTYRRFDWLKRASSLSILVNEDSANLSKEQSFCSPDVLPSGSLSTISTALIAVLELSVPSVFRAVISLHPAGSTNPDAVSFYSPIEGGDYVHARGFSTFHVFRHVTEHADKALLYFISQKAETALTRLLHWIYNYQSLFTKACSKCGRLLVLDKSVNLLLPPVYRSYRKASEIKVNSSEMASTWKGQRDLSYAYHIGCYPD